MKIVTRRIRRCPAGAPFGAMPSRVRALMPGLGPAIGLAVGLVLVPADWGGRIGGVSSAAAQGPVEVEVGGSREVLSGGEEAWDDYWVRATIRPAAGTYAYGGVRHTRRFGEEDQQLEAGVGLPLAEAWQLSLDGTWSPTQRVLPIWGLGGQVTHRLSPQWSVFAGGGRQVWEPTGVNRQHVGVTHHYGPVSAGYTLGFHQVDVGGSGIRHGLEGVWRYDPRGSHVIVGLGVGQDAATVSATELRTVTTESAGVWGTHWLDQRIGVAYAFRVHAYGDYFTRTTSRVGFRYRY